MTRFVLALGWIAVAAGAATTLYAVVSLALTKLGFGRDPLWPFRAEEPPHTFLVQLDLTPLDVAQMDDTHREHHRVH